MRLDPIREARSGAVTAGVVVLIGVEILLLFALTRHPVGLPGVEPVLAPGLLRTLFFTHGLVLLVLWARSRGGPAGRRVRALGVAILVALVQWAFAIQTSSAGDPGGWVVERVIRPGASE